MIDFSDKPLSLKIAAPVFYVDVIIGILYVFFAVKSLFESPSIDQMAVLGLFIYAPFSVFIFMQVAVILAVGYMILRGMYKWSKAAIVAGVFTVPLALLLILASVANSTDFRLDLQTSGGVVILLFVFLAPLFMAVVAYHDIKYRLPATKSKIARSTPGIGK
ncbi:hypothetical protein EON76_03275 [bacterium]|nr:MAG: hypothetical protein EON76_03275 [bacterium]